MRERTSEIRHIMGLLMRPVCQVICAVLCMTSWVQSIPEPSHFYPYGPEDGDAELPPSDHGGSPTIPLPTQFVVFGTCMNALWVSSKEGASSSAQNWQSNNL